MLSKDAVAFLQVDRESNIADLRIDDVFAGLVGPACETEAYVNGVMRQAPMDRGSQVTTISRFLLLKISETPLYSPSAKMASISKVPADKMFPLIGL